MKKIGVIGAGAWGSALACAARRAGNDVILQAHEAKVCEIINANLTNQHYLPDVKLEAGIVATPDMADLVKCDVILLVTPAQFVRETCRQLDDFLDDKTPLLICAKGIELESGKIMSEVITEELPRSTLGVLSGPTFAIEVAHSMPSACTIAMNDLHQALALCDILGSSTFRLYASDDIIGAQIGGAVKNVLAIASGMASGKGFGDNARAALITRGISEIIKLAAAKGGKPETLMGLSGMGDITLTCNSLQSRNFSLGHALGQGQSLDDILKKRKAVTEGIYTASSVCKLAANLHVEMPICEGVNAILNDGAGIDETVKDLLGRPFKKETSR